MIKRMRALLISTYDLGRQPFGLAVASARLRAAGHEVACFDTSRHRLPPAAFAGAELVAFFLPMHTAARLALGMLPQVAAAAPAARLAAFGLYAPMLAGQLRAAGCEVLGVEFPGAPDGAPDGEPVVPDRSGLPPLTDYARLQLPDGSSRVAGATEATRGCKHRCRHCPVVPVYGGKFRVTGEAVVLADIRQQVAAGAEHITFGDPDFFNGPAYAVRIVEALHREWPTLSYDVTIKIEHLLRHRELLPRLRATGCLLVTTAVESFDDAILARLDKGHTASDFEHALALTRGLGLALNPTFLPFTPWTTVASHRAFEQRLEALGLAEQVTPVQRGIRLLLPPGSHLLDCEDAPQWLGDYDAAALSYTWRALEPAADELCREVQATVAKASREKRPRITIPYLDEPWFC